MLRVINKLYKILNKIAFEFISLKCRTVHLIICARGMVHYVYWSGVRTFALPCREERWGKNKTRSFYFYFFCIAGQSFYI